VAVALRWREAKRGRSSEMSERDENLRAYREIALKNNTGFRDALCDGSGLKACFLPYANSWPFLGRGRVKAPYG
jgi:hypothetical protein